MNRIRKDEVSAVDIFAVIVVVLIIIAGVMSILLYTHMTIPPHESPEFPVVEEGDEVQFVYTGFLENSLVFETLEEDVAKDNQTYPKSLLFEYPYFPVDPVTFIWGKGIGGGDFEGLAASGKVLEDALLHLRVNETVTVEVSLEEGFGEPDPAKIVSRSLTETRDQKEAITTEDFFERFGTQAVVNATFIDPIWGWDVRVASLSEVPGSPDEVTLINLPTPGMNVTPYVGFRSQVVSVESGVNEGKGEILLRHLLTSEDAHKAWGNTTTGEGKFIVVSVDEAAGTFVADFNSEKTSGILRYRITIVSIEKG